MFSASDWAALDAMLDVIDPPQTDVFDALGYEPVCKPRVEAQQTGVPTAELPAPCGQCPQERFMNLPDVNMDVLYGGAGGGGKSQSLLMYALRSCVRYPGLQAFWFRRSFPELNQSVLRMLARFNYAKQLRTKWDGSKYELRFPGGSILTFAHAKNREEAAALSSAEINLLILDERTTINPDVVDFLYTRVRSGVQSVPCLGVRSAANPGFIGHGVVKAGWVEATDYGKKIITDAAGRTRVFIPAKVTDNPYVKNYAATLRGIGDPELRRRILDGDWGVMPDQAFPDWRRARIVVPPVVEIPTSWPRHGGLDYGWTAPAVFLGAARDNDGRLWFYRELSMRQTAEREQAKRIKEVAPEVRLIHADPSMWGKSGSALPPAAQYALEGVHLEKGDNDRVGGKGRFHTYLSFGPACAYHRSIGQEMCPMLHVIDGMCPDLLRTMENLPRDPHRSEDVDSSAEDHWYDAARYLLMGVGGGPSFLILDTMPDEVNTTIIVGEPFGQQFAVHPSLDAADWWVQETTHTAETSRPRGSVTTAGAQLVDTSEGDSRGMVEPPELGPWQYH